MFQAIDYTSMPSPQYNLNTKPTTEWSGDPIKPSTIRLPIKQKTIEEHVQWG